MSRHKNTKKFPHLKQSVRIPIPINSTSKFFSKLIPLLYPWRFAHGTYLQAAGTANV